MQNAVNGSTEPCKFASNLLAKMYSKNKPRNFVAPNSVVQLDVDKDSLENEQLIKKCDMGLKFWFDKANQPKETLEKIVFNYALQTEIDGNKICVKLPDVDNGIWQLFSQEISKGNPTKLDVENNVHICELNEDTEFYAELYVNNKLVYTTPRCKVCVTNAPSQEDDEKKDTQLPSLLDFWYW